MRNRNNLSDIFENTYFEATDTFQVLCPIGHYDTNTFVGSSCMIGVLYSWVTVNPGDQIHDLFGGVYLVQGNKMTPCRTYISDKHPFEKVYSPEEEQYPLDKLKQIASPNKELELVNKFPTVNRPQKYCGRGIDSIQSSAQ